MNHNAIQNLYPNAISIITTEDGITTAYDENGDSIAIDSKAVQTETVRLQTEYANKKYQRDRAAEYPSFADQFDLLYHGGLDAWKAAIDEVKTKYPKP